MFINKKIILKNSLILYLRLLITTIIALYTSRIILIELGSNNFGLYAIVGGIVSLMNLMGSTILTTSNRFIAVELGSGGGEGLNAVFNRLLVLHIIVGFFLMIITETFGVWFINNHLKVDSKKLLDAVFVLRVSVFAALISTISMPYQSLISVYEKFSAKAIIEVCAALTSFIAVITLKYYSGNKLRFYSCYVLVIQFSTFLLYYFYCKVNFSKIIKWKFDQAWSEYKIISRYFGWQLLYVFGAIGSKKGQEIILNLFFGTILNAAFAIANKVYEFVFGFVRNLNEATIPQIMKSYNIDSGGSQKSIALVYKLSKWTFFLMLIPAMPILISADSILSFWLMEVPEHTVSFVVLIIIHGFVSSLESGFDSIVDVTGKIKKTKIFFTILFLSILPLSFYLYTLKFPPYTIQLLFIFAEIIFICFQIFILTTITEFKIQEYAYETLLPSFTVLILVLPQFTLPLVFGEGVMNLFMLIFSSIFLTSITIFFVGLSKNERIATHSWIVNRFFGTQNTFNI